MMKKLIPALIIGMGLSAGAFASDGTITINGALTAQTCTIVGNNQGSDFTVTLPKISTAALSAAGSNAGAVPFSIVLSNCMPVTGTVATYFEYGANTLADGNLKNAVGGQYATNVEVQLLNNDMSPIDVSKGSVVAQGSTIKFITAGGATLPYVARYASPLGGATAGDVNTTVTYSMNYQ
ncbi:fimbrial protein [Silvimonas soli]|uniref:fimbrial protein n=1 Tax=Silvimonas soli TaxID=2980100 RepID=UPI0024B370DB|nr:fimbrial protein [Silvimonas soli]